jgi:hypothetical protein
LLREADQTAEADDRGQTNGPDVHTSAPTFQELRLVVAV